MSVLLSYDQLRSKIRGAADYPPISRPWPLRGDLLRLHG
jgi:hypothetical protein